MNKTRINLTNVRVASAPIFFPADDPKKHQCALTVIKNRGKNKAGQELTEVYRIRFWGKYAQTAALYLKVGRAICVDAVSKGTYNKETGMVGPNGKPMIQHETVYDVQGFEFGPDSKKNWIERLTLRLEEARRTGLIPPNCTLGAEFLLTTNAIPKYDYNPQLAAQSGKYGNARVWVKGIGFLGNGTGAPVAAGAGASPVDAEKAALQARIAELERLAGGQAAVAGAGDVNPF
jgi:hypothetical protein